MKPSLAPALVLAAALAAPLAPPAAASTPNSGPAPWDDSFATTAGAQAGAVTGHLKAVITELQDDRVVKIWDEKSRSEHLVRFAEQVPISARKKAMFDNRSELLFDDLRPGHRLKVTFLTRDGSILKVKVIGEVDELPGPSGL